MKKQPHLILILLILFLSSQSLHAKFCETINEADLCLNSLLEHKLFDSSAKLHANYLPILALRALAHADIYKKKKDFKIERFFFENDKVYEKDTDELPYASLIGVGKVSGNGFFGREIEFAGTLNAHTVKYKNVMKFSLPRRADMQVNAWLDEIEFLDLQIQSDADKMTNDVSGKYFGKAVKYHTTHRDSFGILADIPYKLHTEGKVKEDDLFHAVTDGLIDENKVTGAVNFIEKNHYYSIEHYGPIRVETHIRILN